MNELLYVKYSNERAEEFSIRTELQEDENGIKRIVKAPISSRSVKHIANMYDSYLKLVELYQSEDVAINACSYEDGIAVFEYIEGDTLQERVDSYISLGQLDKVHEIIDRVVEMISAKAVEKFVYTDEFEHIFGNVEGLDGSRCSDVSDVDMIFSNIIINDRINIIDYEWTFVFPIPYKYIVFRLCFFLIHQSNVRHIITLKQLMLRYHITREEYDRFAVMEENFQKYIRGSRTTLREMGTSSMEHVRSINDINKIYINNPFGLYVYIYITDCERKTLAVQENIVTDGRFDRQIDVGGGSLELEINCGCGLLIFKQMDFTIKRNNGMKIAENTYLYISDKMDIEIENTKADDGVKLEFSVIKMDVDGVTNLKDAIDKFVLENARLRDELSGLR